MSLQAKLNEYLAFQRKAQEFVEFEKGEGPLQELYDKYADSQEKSNIFFVSVGEAYRKLREDLDKVLTKLRKIVGATEVTCGLGRDGYLIFLWDLKKGILPEEVDSYPFSPNVKKLIEFLKVMKLELGVEAFESGDRLISGRGMPLTIEHDLTQLKKEARVDYMSGSLKGWRFRLAEYQPRKGRERKLLEVVLGKLSPRKEVMVVKVSPKMVEYLAKPEENPKIAQSLESLLKSGKDWKKNSLERFVDRIRESR